MRPREWFKRWGDYVIPARYFENRADFTVEEMYQMFKGRLISEERRRAKPDSAGEKP